MLGRALEDEGGPEAATGVYLDLVDSHAYSEYTDSVRAVLSHVYFAAGDYRRALDHILGPSGSSTFFERRLVPWYLPAKGEELYMAAVAYSRLGETDSAIRLYKRYIQAGSKQTHSFDASMALYDLLRERGDYDAARRLLVSLPTRGRPHEEEFRLRSELGALYFAEGNYSRAREEYARALKRAPKGVETIDVEARAVVCFFREKKIKDANRAEERFVHAHSKRDIDQFKAEFFFERGLYYIGSKDWDPSRTILKRVAKDYSETEHAVLAELELAKLDIATNRTDDAADRLMRMTTTYDNHEIIPQVYNSLGGIYYAASQFENAIAAYHKAVDHPSVGQLLPVAMTNLLRCYEDVGRWQDAILLAGGLIDRFPESENHFVLQIKIGNYLMNFGDYEKARDHFKEILLHADAESTAEIQYWIGECYLNMRDYSQAIAQFLKVPYLAKPTKLDWSASAWWKAGNAYEKLENYEKAAYMYNRIIQEKGAESNFGRFARQRIDDLRLLGKLLSEPEG